MTNLQEREEKETTVKTGLYLYCIINSADSDGDWHKIVGQNGSPLFSVSHRDLSAIVSVAPLTKQSVSREKLIGHAAILEKIMAYQQILPIRFGIVATDQEEVENKVLKANYWNFCEILKTLKGKKELGLKIIWDEKAALAQIVEEDKQICHLRDQIAGKPNDSVYYEKIQLGRLVEAAVTSYKTEIKEEVLGELMPLSVDYRENKLLNETMVLNAAFLVPVENEGQFDERLNMLNTKYDQKLTFKYTAIAPPYNFVNIAINL